MLSLNTMLQIYWDSLWSAPIDARQHRPLYEHGVKHAAVWGIHTFLCNGQVRTKMDLLQAR